MKNYLDIDVLEASKQRISYLFDNFENIYLSFSGGKDSTIMFHLTLDEAIKRNRKIGVLIVDLEAQYKLTIQHIKDMINLYKYNIDLYWICLPIALRNAVSQYEPKWCCWEDGKDWVRQPPKEGITDINYFPFFYKNMEFEDFVSAFGKWYGKGENTACLVGIRADESLNRYRTIKFEGKNCFRKQMFTTHVIDLVYNAYPIYDWKTKDIWIYNAKFKKCYNKLYDRMHQAGLSIHQQRICQPYGDDQRKGLWLYHIIEPETWGKLISRVNGANFGALYVCETGNIFGNIKISLPDGHTWKSFAELLLKSMPQKTREHYENKIIIFLKWWGDKDILYKNGIPDEEDKKKEMNKEVPSWRRICRCLLKNDYWCKSLSFGMQVNSAYQKYRKLMNKRKKQEQYKQYLLKLKG